MIINLVILERVTTTRPASIGATALLAPLVLALTTGCTGSGSPSAAPTSTSSSTTIGATGPASATPTPSAITPVSDGQVHAKDITLAAGLIGFNEIQWWEGKAARRQCRQDGQTTGQLPWCTTYYFKDTNPLVRHLPTAKNIVIKVPGYRLDSDRGSGLTRVSLRQLTSFIMSKHPLQLVHLTIRNNEITELDEIFES